MQQLTFTKLGRLEWREVPEPVHQGARDALVRPIAVARCDLDRVFLTTPVATALRAGIASHLVDRVAENVGGSPPYAPPFPVGHECVAEVLSVAAEVKQFRVGQRVVVPFQIACGACGTCARGLTSRCDEGTTVTKTYGFGPGARIYGGVLSDVVRVPYADAMLVPLPDGVDPINYYDADPERLAIAERLGARALPAARSGWLGKLPTLPRRYAMSVDASSDMRARGLELALRSLQPGGLCTSVGIYPQRRTPVPLMQMYVDGVTLRTGISNSRPLIPEVLALVAQGRLDPRPVTTRVASWRDASDAFLENTTKVVIAR